MTVSYKDNTDDFLKELDKKIRRRLMLSVLTVERRAKLNCPVLTGTAKRSIIGNWYGSERPVAFEWAGGTKSVKGKKYKIKAGASHLPILTEKEGIVGSNVEYFPYIELGTTKMTARAPLRRALQQSQPQLKRIWNAK